MKIPIEWLKEYIDTHDSTKDLADKFTVLGLMLDKIENNKVIDLEHRMDRSDWLSIIGCARDLAAMDGKKLKMPEMHKEEGTKPTEIVKIKVEATDLVKRFNTRVFKGINVKESPEWLKRRLEEYGMPSINNIVDITNYVMIEFGQPMHAQDLSKFEKQEIVLRRAKEGEQITTLDGTTIKVGAETLILAENDNLIAIGAVVGGQKTQIDENTTNIVLDAGNYDQTNVRKTSRRLKIYNETVQRTDKFLHPESTQFAIERATWLILELAGGKYYENFDYYPNKILPKQMKLRYSRITKISGMSFDTKRVKEILNSLEYKVLKESNEDLFLEVPYFRTDVEVEDDLVSDILRINNYSNIPLTPISTAPPREITPQIYILEDRLRDAMISMGLHEHITDPLVQYSEKNIKQVKLQNALTSEKNALRTTIYETLYPVIQTYKKHGLNNAGIFEIGKIYKLEGSGSSLEDYREIRVLECICKGSSDVYINSKKLRNILSGLWIILGIKNVSYKEEETRVKIYIDNTNVGELSNSSFFLLTEALSYNEPNLTRVKSEINSKIAEDVTFMINADESAGAIIEQIIKFDENILSCEVLDEYLKEDKKSITVRVFFESSENLTSPQVNEIKKSLLEKLKSEFPVNF